MRSSFLFATCVLSAALALGSVAQAQTTQVPGEVKAGAYVTDAGHTKVT